MDVAIVTLNRLGASFVTHACSMFVQVGILIVVLWPLDRILYHYLRASLRYGLWMLILIKLVLSPSFSLPTGVGSWIGSASSRSGAGLPAYIFGQRTARPKTAEVSDSPPKAAMPYDTGMWPSEALMNVATGDVQAQPASVRLTWQGVAMAVWLAVVSALGLALLMRRLCVRRIVHDAAEPSETLRDLLERCRLQVGTSRQIELKVTDDLSGPAVCRVRRPVILVPRALTDGLSEEKQRAILIHELCHIKRADTWVNLAQTLLQVFYFYNPLVWLANSCIRRVREQAVDEMVLVCLKEPSEAFDGLTCYSHTLIDIASAMTLRARLGMGMVGVAESKTRLDERIQLMLHRPIPRNARLGTMGLVTLILLGCILLPMASAGGASGGAAFAPADEATSQKLFAQIDQTADAFVKAFNDRDISALMSHIADDVIAMPPGALAVVGKDEMQKMYLKEMARGTEIQMAKLTLPNQRLWVCGDLIYTNAAYKVVMKAPQLGAISEVRRGVIIWQRRKDGSLQVKVEAFNRIAAPKDAGQADTTAVYRCTAGSPTVAMDSKLAEKIRDIEARFEKLFVDGRPTEALAYYTDDATLMNPDGGAVHGRAELAQVFEASAKQQAPCVEQKIARIEGNDQMLYVVNWFGWTLENPVSGIDYTIPGKGLHVWQRQADGSWKILLDLNSIDVTL
jgi:beta-lactamase regulating signal transducer with metallopeptidase domain/ketosteroid isomerase-like protein